MHRIVLMGAGEVSTKSAVALVDDLWSSISGDKRILLPVTGEQLGRVASMMAEWAIDVGAPFELLGDEFEVTDRVFDSALRIHEVSDPVVAAVSMMSVTDHLVIAWDDDDPHCLTALRLASDAGIRAMDLTTGLAELQFSEDEDPEEQLPVTMPTRDDELREPFEVLVNDALAALDQAREAISRAAIGISGRMSPTAIRSTTSSTRREKSDALD